MSETTSTNRDYKYCQNCGAKIDIKAIFCPHCGVPVAPTTLSRKEEKGQKHPGVAAVLSFLWPGLGQIFNGQIGRGLGIMLLALIFALFSLALIGLPFYIALWAWGIADAYRYAENYNKEA